MQGCEGALFLSMRYIFSSGCIRGALGRRWGRKTGIWPNADARRGVDVAQNTWQSGLLCPRHREYTVESFVGTEATWHANERTGCCHSQFRASDDPRSSARRAGMLWRLRAGKRELRRQQLLLSLVGALHHLPSPRREGVQSKTPHAPPQRQSFKLRLGAEGWAFGGTLTGMLRDRGGAQLSDSSQLTAAQVLGRYSTWF
jgi:hypothetical protein